MLRNKWIVLIEFKVQTILVTETSPDEPALYFKKLNNSVIINLFLDKQYADKMYKKKRLIF